MSIAVAALAVAMASLLLWASVEKFRSPGGTIAALQALGAPTRVAHGAVAALALLEALVGMALCFAPEQPATHAGVLVLAGGFSLAGLLAILQGESIECSCFGPSLGARLGRAQLLALPLWLGGLLVLHMHAATAGAEIGANRFATASLLIAFIRLPGLWRAYRQARGDRLSASETYVWLR